MRVTKKSPNQMVAAVSGKTSGSNVMKTWDNKEAPCC